MSERVAERVSALLNSDVVSIAPMQGGDLSAVLVAALSDGTRVVAKLGPQVAIEGAMLTEMAQRGVPVPDVLAQDGDLLILEHLPETRATPRGWSGLGAAVRTLHTATSPDFGWTSDYAFGRVPILNRPAPDWPRFWAENRLLPFVPDLPDDLARRVAALCDRLPGLLPDRPRAALLHGDLWPGNVLFTARGPYLIDPACHFGDAEVDLAMLTLFGQPDRAFWQSYGPLPDGWHHRRPIYQLWPALVHLRLFGSGYRGMVENCLGAAGS